MSKMASAMCQNQFLGSRISLVSKSDSRYEGILYALDLNEATISLAKVRCFGTEDRPTERPVPPREDTFEYIVFRGPDIKVIDVVEPPKHASNSGLTGLPSDPAIVDFSHNAGGGHFGSPFEGGRMRQNGSNNVLNNLFKGGRGGGPQMNMGSPQRRYNNGGYDNRMQHGRGNMNRNMGGGQGGGRQNYGQQGGRMNYGGNFRQGFIPNGQFQQRGRMTTPTRGGNYGQPQRRGGRQGGGGGGGRYQNRARGMNVGSFPPKVSFESDFDFEEAQKELIASLEKTKIDNETEAKSDENSSKDDQDKEPQIFYKKDNFFDNISCESLERSKGTVPRVDWKAERKLNAETFGLSQNPNNGGNNMRNNRRAGGQRMPRGMPNISRGPGGGGNWMSPNKFYNGGNNHRRGGRIFV